MAGATKILQATIEDALARPESDRVQLIRGSLVEKAGWGRERCPSPPAGRPIRLRPDWICEILSPSNERTDRVEKLQSHFHAGVPHYWLVDPAERVLEVYAHGERDYHLTLTAGSGQAVRAAPFDAVELRVDDLFDADSEDD